MGLTLADLDSVSVSFIVEILEERNKDTNEEDNIIEATPEMLDTFF